MVKRPHLNRYVSKDVTLLGDTTRPGGVTLAFTERTGGFSEGSYASLNLGDACGDDPELVAKNRRRLLEALGCEGLMDRLVNPRQVHGSDVLVVDDATSEGVRAARNAARDGVDAIVCTVPQVPVLLCFADCVPVILVAPRAFAVVHSGRMGCERRVSAKAFERLCEAAHCTPADVSAYIGPHIGAQDYEVSLPIAEDFARHFGAEAVVGERNLDLGLVVRQTLIAAGMAQEAISDECPTTAEATDRFFSYRAQGGTCGRHGAFAVMLHGCQEGGTDE